MNVKIGFLGAVCAGLILASGCKENKGGEASGEGSKLTNEKDSVSYAIGLDIARGMKEQKYELNPDMLAQGMKDFGTEKALMNQDQIMQTLMAWQQKQAIVRQEEAKKMAGENLKKGEEFLAGNKTKEGVVTLPSGVQYKVLVPGTGKQPRLTDQVSCNYRGTLIDGTEFDSSFKNNAPATFPLQGVIKGWQEILPLMKEGAKWQCWVPAASGYGEMAPPNIGPNQVLIFEIELLKVLDPGSQPARPDMPR